MRHTLRFSALLLLLAAAAAGAADQKQKNVSVQQTDVRATARYHAK